ncbi:hypothetical protein FQN55_004635 [Onygenales sp. PD_40]|nr:hypothetical protein FQN55_004635 [Onygenales sp. PD_40]KAK2781166.1 hypothetical protein FQN53_000777 [Emmonsiellopsis sp. PD_33]KAK2795080.1 hypothetical protein FQN51_000596 [Onygenales sp. PD_10]
MEDRVAIPVSLPHPNPTVSYWQDPPDKIADLRSTPELPAKVDIAIIGSGISGATIAHNILCRAPKTVIVMLEARQASSGATGRNGAHTKGATYTTFAADVEKLGLDEAIKIAKFELKTIRLVHGFAQEHGIDCESSRLDTADIIYNQEDLDRANKTIEIMRKAMPNDPASEYKVWNSKETEKRLFVSGAAGSITYEAGSINAYKFVIGILKLCLKHGLNLQTGTAATQLSRKTEGNSTSWTVTTARGNIQAKRVIMATNAYSAAIYPAFQGVIVPARGQVTAHRPGSHLPQHLTTTYSFNYGSGYDYMIQCPDSSKYPGDIVIGGGFVRGINGGLTNYGNTNDAVVEPVTSEYLAASTVEFFGRNWGKDDPAGRVRTEWTGIFAVSPDGYPLVGEMPGEPGLFVSAAFNGHGMALSLLCSQALTSMMFGDSETALYSWFPKAYKVTAQRLAQRLRAKERRPTENVHTKARL